MKKMRRRRRARQRGQRRYIGTIIVVSLFVIIGVLYFVDDKPNLPAIPEDGERPGIDLAGQAISALSLAREGLPLYTGWNVVSLPSSLHNVHVTSGLATLSNSMLYIYDYSTGRYYFNPNGAYAAYPSYGYPVFDRLQTGRTYGIYQTRGDFLKYGSSGVPLVSSSVPRNNCWVHHTVDNWGDEHFTLLGARHANNGYLPVSYYGSGVTNTITTKVYSSVAQTIGIAIYCDETLKVSLNGNVVHTYGSAHLWSPTTINLNSGWNDIEIECTNWYGGTTGHGQIGLDPWLYDINTVAMGSAGAATDTPPVCAP